MGHWQLGNTWGFEKMRYSPFAVISTVICELFSAEFGVVASALTTSRHSLEGTRYSSVSGVGSVLGNGIAHSSRSRLVVLASIVGEVEARHIEPRGRHRGCVLFLICFG